jgi:short-chain Z-isoprenyl diphosphate synthase
MAERVVAPPLPRPRGLALSRTRRRLTGALLSPLYRLYTGRLRHEVRAAPIPHHLAVILDGNRRWASEEGLDEVGAGHRHGADKIDELLAWCAELGVSEVTLWALSGENLGRDERELDALLDVVSDKLDALSEQPVRIRVFGRLEGLPPRLLEAVGRAETRTADNPGLRLNIAIGYSGRNELVDACRAMMRSLATRGVPPERMADEVTPELLSAHLYTAGAPDPELIIRTSGELRLSGFLPWQSVHSEFHFADVYWPAFRELDFLRAIRTYQQRERRYGR